MGSSHGSHLPGSAGGIPRYSRPAVRALTVPAGSWRLGCVDGRWASSFSSHPTIQQTGPDRFQVTDPTDPVRPRMAIVAGTRPVTTGQATLWVITSISPVPS